MDNSNSINRRDLDMWSDLVVRCIVDTGMVVLFIIVFTTKSEALSLCRSRCLSGMHTLLVRSLGGCEKVVERQAPCCIRFVDCLDERYAPVVVVFLLLLLLLLAVLGRPQWGPAHPPTSRHPPVIHYGRQRDGERE